jgi:threonine 3-dehydrogenase
VGVNRAGCFAELLSLPACNAFKLSPALSDELGSILDPYGNATHTALSFNLVGEDVLITGAGPIGAMAVAIARFAGARHVVITDVNPYRLDLARKLGATRALDVRTETLDDVGRSQCLPRNAAHHASRRQRGHARHHAKGHGHQLG